MTESCVRLGSEVCVAEDDRKRSIDDLPVVHRTCSICGAHTLGHGMYCGSCFIDFTLDTDPGNTWKLKDDL